MSRFIVETAGLTKIYHEGGAPLPVLMGVDVQISFGEIVALRGPSGSGKSTLLNILGCLDRPTRGHYWLGGRDVSGLDRAAQAWVRLHYIGFVFQTFHLIAHSTALENVALPMHYAGIQKEAAVETARNLLGRVGLEHRLDHRPNQLSGGQRQRVAVARALACSPRQILSQFLVEGVLLSLLGATFGIILGVGVSVTVAGYMGWQRITSIGDVVLAASFGIAVGLVFGFLPARRAALLDPIEALRRQ